MGGKRKHLDLGQKASIIFEIQSGEKTQVQVCRERDLSTSTVNNIWKDRDKILKNHLNVDPNLKKVRPCTFPEIDKRLIKWHDLQRNRNVPLSGVLLLEQARKIAEDLQEASFKASQGCLGNWKKRHGITFVTVSGEAGAVDDDVVTNWLQNIWPGLKAEFKPEDIFNCDESALFYKLLPNKTMSRKGRVCTGGKLSKERVTILLGTNATGSEKLKPTIIGRAENPRCFKNVKKRARPVDYYFNKKAWMTQDIFTTWVKKLDLKMRFKKRKILLLVDNCSGHKIREKTPNVRIVLLPPNVTAKLQPLDLGIINATKNHYKFALVRKIIDRLDDGKDPSIDLLEGIMGIAAAWNKVSPSTIYNCFKKSKLVSEEHPSDVEEEEDIEETISDADWSQITPEGSLEDYLNADNNVMTFDENDEDEGTEEESESDAGEDDVEVDRDLISTGMAQKHVEELKTWYLVQEKESLTFWPSITQIEDFILQQGAKNKRQSEITEYFQPSAE